MLILQTDAISMYPPTAPHIPGGQSGFRALLFPNDAWNGLRVK